MSAPATPSPSEPNAPRCQNCSAPLNGPYCASCGQRDIEFKRDWKGLVGEYASSFLNVDGKIPRGLFQILFRPGLSTKVFLDGKRSSQIPPLRLYLFASLIFFLWFTTSDTFQIVAPTEAEMAQLNEDARPGSSAEALSEKMQEKFQSPDAFIASVNTWLPRVFLLGVPTLALATRIVFRKRGYVYLEHAIISMHLQTFLLLWVLLVGILSDLLSIWNQTFSNYFWNVSILWIQVYCVIALKRIFELSWKRAIGSTLLLNLLFLLMFGGGLALVLLISFYIG
ncbi:DUF3667 domain-containing protein [Pelagicoccus mobilis]|uniref:DUF3667 domain-containing protein n=1 Tax=Pelagicoccus mobilis TaxID=415221 RepID=A0A934RS35_9BACT|nr:DUF3667 domain-containing protein [Pelagicoccus mobilis]MBK1876565.1 DUF3667 domain-containing protein [Pelagicoccus mobilis]